MALTATQSKSMYQFFALAFNAAPGVTYMNQLDAAINSGMSVTQVVEAFTSKAEFTSTYPGFLSNEAFATRFINNNVGSFATDAAKTAAIADIAAALNAGWSRGKTITQVFTNISNLPETDATWGNVVKLVNNKVAYAQYYTETMLGGAEATPVLATLRAVIANVTPTTSVVVADMAAVLNPAPVPVAQTFTLTTGVNNFVGGTTADTFTAPEATLTGGDTLDGGAGSDTLYVVDDTAFSVAVGAVVKNIENITVTAGTTVTLDTTAAAFNSGVTGTVTTTSTGGASVTTGTADISVTESSVTAADGNVTVLGGKAVTVAVTGTTTDGDAAAEIVVGSATKAATGAVTVTSAFTGSNGNDAADIAVVGGTAVSVTQSLGNAVNTTNTHGTVSVTGSASTTSVTVTQDKAATAAAAVVGKVNGAVTIADKNATSTTLAGTVTSVTLNNYGNSTVDSNGLATVNLSGTGGTIGITTDSRTTALATTLALNVNSLSAPTDNTITVDSDVTTLNITSSTAASTVTALIASGATTVNVAGDAKLTLTGNTLGAATAINVTNTAGAVFGTTAIGTGVTFTGGAGADSVILSNAFTKAITMGDGDDTVTYGGAAGTGGSVAAGNGTDTIVMTAAQAAAADDNSTFNSKFTGFEVLDLGVSGANTIVLAGINGVNSVTTSGATGALVLDGFSSGGTLKLNADVGAGSYQANVTNALFNAADTFNINLSKTGGVLAAGSVTVGGVETINMTAADAATAGSAAVIHTATLVATGATTVNVSGNNGLTLTNTGNTAVTKFDASGVVANGTADTAANLAVTFASANTTTTANVTIVGGAGADTLTGNAAKDNITGGAGADIVAGGAGQDTINVGNGRDVVRVAANSDAQVAASESTTAAADVVNGFALSSAIATATNLSSASNFQGSTAGGANLAMLSIDLTADDANAGTNGANLAVAIEANGTGAGQAAGVTYTATSGILTLTGSGAASVDTLAEWLTEAAAVSATAGETIAFVFGSDTYVFAQNGAQDALVQLVGVSAGSLVLAGAATTASAGAVIIGDSL